MKSSHHSRWSSKSNKKSLSTSKSTTGKRKAIEQARMQLEELISDLMKLLTNVKRKYTYKSTMQFPYKNCPPKIKDKTMKNSISNI